MKHPKGLYLVTLLLFVMTIFQQMRISRLEHEVLHAEERLTELQKEVTDFMGVAAQYMNNTNSAMTDHTEAIRSLTRSMRIMAGISK
jgi:hypothetical protein